MRTTRIYDVASKTWSDGPKMNTKRYGHACFADEETSRIHVMGGLYIFGPGIYAPHNMLDSTEVWTFGADSWQYSANLPEVIDYSSAVASKSDEYVGYIAGGNTRIGTSRKLWGLRREDMTWIVMNKELKIERIGHSLLNVPVKEILGC